MTTGNLTFQAPGQGKVEGIKGMDKVNLEKMLANLEAATTNLNESNLSSNALASRALEQMTDLAVLLRDLKDGTRDSYIWERAK